MRVSTGTIYETGTNLMLQQQEKLINTQQLVYWAANFNTLG